MKVIMKIFILFLVITFNNVSNAQGINFQGVARSANGTILASQNISLKLSIIPGTSTNTPEYVESRMVFTNPQGIFSIIIGDTGAISTNGNFANVNWKLNNKYLKVEMDPLAGNNFITMGTTPLQYVPYSFYSNGVDAVNVAGVLPVKSGGTGVATLNELKTALSIEKVNNTADLDKPISTLTQTSLDSKLNKIDTAKLSARIDTKAPINNPVFTGIITGTLSGTSSNVTGIVSVVNGGTNTTTLSLNNVVIGNGNNGVKFVAPGVAGNVLTSDGTTWNSIAPNQNNSQMENKTRRILNYIYLKN